LSATLNGLTNVYSTSTIEVVKDIGD